MSLTLPAAGREYATWAVAGADIAVALEVSFDAGVTWTATDRVDAGTARILVAGPTATGNPVGTVVLPVGRHLARIRATDTPEVAIRDAGAIDVT